MKSVLFYEALDEANPQSVTILRGEGGVRRPQGDMREAVGRPQAAGRSPSGGPGAGRTSGSTSRRTRRGF